MTILDGVRVDPCLKYPFEPKKHQLNALRKAWNKRYFAFFHRMGLGKTASAIWLATQRWNFKQIEAVLVIVPNSIKLVWDKEVPAMTPEGIDTLVHVFKSGKQGRDWKEFMAATSHDRIKYLVVGIEALSAGKGKDYVYDFVKYHQCLCVVDESSRIKNHSAIRTKTVIDIGSRCDYRLILTGTPVTQGLEDLFAQFKFLHSGIIDCKSFVVFRNRYCIMGGFENRKVLGYQFVDDLMDKIRPYCDIVTETDDLPPKVYEEIHVELSKEQKQAIKDLHETFEAQSGEDLLTTATVLERLTRYQQIIGGNFPFDEEDGYGTKPIPGTNPKIEALKQFVSDIDHNDKVVIFARFKPEIALIAETLGSAAVEYHGGIDDAGRQASYDGFRQDPNKKYFITNRTGAYGLTLIEASYIFFYSNSFSAEDRWQAEDRVPRIGKVGTTVIVDCVANSKHDKMITTALKSKKDVASMVAEKLDNAEFEF